MKPFFRLFRLLLKFGMPASLLLLPVLAVYGAISPWVPASAGLARYPGQSPVLVGFSYVARQSNQTHYVRSSRSYILLPSVLSDPKLVIVARENDAAATAIESRPAFWFELAWLIACSVGTWWFWFRRAPREPTPLRGSA